MSTPLLRCVVFCFYLLFSSPAFVELKSVQSCNVRRRDWARPFFPCPGPSQHRVEGRENVRKGFFFALPPYLFFRLLVSLPDGSDAVFCFFWSLWWGVRRCAKTNVHMHARERRLKLCLHFSLFFFFTALSRLFSMCPGDVDDNFVYICAFLSLVLLLFSFFSLRFRKGGNSQNMHLWV